MLTEKVFLGDIEAMIPTRRLGLQEATVTDEEKIEAICAIANKLYAAKSTRLARALGMTFSALRQVTYSLRFLGGELEGNDLKLYKAVTCIKAADHLGWENNLGLFETVFPQLKDVDMNAFNLSASFHQGMVGSCVELTRDQADAINQIYNDIKQNCLPEEWQHAWHMVIENVLFSESRMDFMERGWAASDNPKKRFRSNFYATDLVALKRLADITHYQGAAVGPAVMAIINRPQERIAPHAVSIRINGTPIETVSYADNSTVNRPEPV